VIISTNGGAQVRWRPDGKELFYIALDGRLMAVPIRLTSGGSQSVEAGAPVKPRELDDEGAGRDLRAELAEEGDGRRRRAPGRQEIVEHARRLAAKQQMPGALTDMARAIREAAQVWKGKG